MFYNKRIFQRCFDYPKKYWYKNLTQIPLYFKLMHYLAKTDFAIILRSGHESTHNYQDVPRCVINEGTMLTEAYIAMKEVGDNFSIHIHDEETNTEDDEEW